jgi:hypothetical protein
MNLALFRCTAPTNIAEAVALLGTQAARIISGDKASCRFWRSASRRRLYPIVEAVVEARGACGKKDE